MAMEENIKRLVEIAQSIKTIYQNILKQGMTTSNKENLLFAIERERKIYDSIPIQEYQKYMEFFSSNEEIEAFDLLSIMLEYQYFVPEIRIINYLDYLLHKECMFSDNVSNFFSKDKIDEFREYYLIYSELYNNLIIYYRIYFDAKKELFYVLLPSFMNILYSNAYAENFYFGKEKAKEKRILQKFSNLENIAAEIDDYFLLMIDDYFNLFLEQEYEEDLEEQEEKIYNTLIQIFLSTLYFSIDSEECMHRTLSKYKASNYPDLPFKNRNFLDEIQMLVKNSVSLRRKLK